MKSIYLFSTKLKMYWVTLPMAVILALAIIYNPHATGWLKLYPLIFVSAGGIIFMFIFFFRIIKINYTEIKDIGRFSPRDSALINEGKLLVLIPERRGGIRIYLYGEDGLPELDWMRDQTTDPSVICMYRGRTQGGKRAISRVLRYFGASDKDALELLHLDTVKKEYKNAVISTSLDGENKKRYEILITETV